MEAIQKKISKIRKLLKKRTGWKWSVKKHKEDFIFVSLKRSGFYFSMYEDEVKALAQIFKLKYNLNICYDDLLENPNIYKNVISPDGVLLSKDFWLDFLTISTY
jgi:hypothetical protein